jgi:transcriptional regulator with XRE-family HTH domain
MPPKKQPLALVAQLRDTIRASDLSLQELGRRTGVSQGQLSRFLRGERTLTLPAAAKVCEFFGLTLCRTEDGSPRATDSAHDAAGAATAKRSRKK